LLEGKVELKSNREKCLGPKKFEQPDTAERGMVQAPYEDKPRRVTSFRGFLRGITPLSGGKKNGTV